MHTHRQWYNSTARVRVARAGLRLLLACFVFAPAPASAQRSPAEQAADSQFTRRRFAEAATAYKALIASTPSGGLNWANLGESELQLKHYDEAIVAFGKAIDLNFRPFRSIIDQARGWAGKGDEARTVALLQRVVDGGVAGSFRVYVQGATEFNAMRTSPRFAEVAAKMKPCTTEPYRQFDFWIGDWEVQLPNGQVAGRNVVTLEQDGCLLVENWKARGGSSGTSFNYYDLRDKKWHQLYIDNSGNAGAFPPIAGTFTDGRMVLLSDDVNNNMSRWTWYVMEPGKVKQMQEASSDHGKTWQVGWNSVYVKKP